MKNAIKINKKKELGSFYTPDFLANYLAKKLINFYVSEYKLTQNPKRIINILDPACGDGELILAIKNQLAGSAIEVNHDKNLFIGLDIDKKAIVDAKRNLSISKNNNIKIINTNGLLPFNNDFDTGWQRLEGHLKIKNKFDLIIANPPWGADKNIYKEGLKRNRFELLHGQYDTSDLFIESSLRLLNIGGFAAFIIPDSLFYAERLNLRKFLLKNTTIKMIGRFGEGIFKEVNRSCAIIIFQNKQAKKNNKILCLRVNKKNRDLLLNEDKRLDLIEKEASIMTLQKTFSNEKNFNFHIDTNQKYEKILKKINCNLSNIGNYVNITRGVEISKRGIIKQCSNCKNWLPLPKNLNVKCPNCKVYLDLNSLKSNQIIHSSNTGKSQKLILGEDIKRYSIKHKSFIEINKKGINYKNKNIYSEDKILVRKTGIGISASIDYTGAFTTQVVYILSLKEKEKGFYFLEFILILLCSRLGFFYVALTSGETEWKSHPYLTQTKIKDIPLPKVCRLSKKEINEINELGQKVKKLISTKKSIDNELDARCERLVAKIFKLNKKDYEIIYDFINNSQELLPVKALKKIKLADLFK